MRSSTCTTFPKQLKATVVFDQSAFVKEAIKTLLHEGLIGLALTSLMILIFLGSLRATSAVFLSIPLSALATFVVLYMMGSTDQHDDSGRAGAGLFAHHRQLGDLAGKHLPASGTWAPRRWRLRKSGGSEVSLAVLAATLTTVVVFFPVTFLYGVSKFLFSALALAVVISLFASYVVAMTVIPLFCSRFLQTVPHASGDASHEYEIEPTSAVGKSWWERFTAGFNPAIQPAAGFLRVLGEARAGATRPDGGDAERRVPGQPGDLSVSGSGLFPAAPTPGSSRST